MRRALLCRELSHPEGSPIPSDLPCRGIPHAEGSIAADKASDTDDSNASIIYLHAHLGTFQCHARCRDQSQGRWSRGELVRRCLKMSLEQSSLGQRLPSCTLRNMPIPWPVPWL